MQIQIHPIHFHTDTKLVDLITEKLEKLPHYYSKIETADVYLKLDSNASNVKEKIVEIKLHVPGADLFATQTSNMFEAAFDLCLDQIKKQLIKKKEKMTNA
jgi:putative sigma-54 modulation protein